MKVIKLIFLIAITMALATITLTTKNFNDPQELPPLKSSKPVLQDLKSIPVKRVSRFLVEKAKNPRAADHCNKDNEICYVLEGGRNSTCCNNKCMDLGYDDKNCGACKQKCKFTDTCCRGECVNLAYDKRHCGICNNRCMPGGYCIYGLCDYA